VAIQNCDGLSGDSGGPHQSGLPILRRPVLDFHQQLKIVISFLRGQLINHDMQPSLLVIRSNPGHPQNRNQSNNGVRPLHYC
jgi:hypothetical protein